MGTPHRPSRNLIKKADISSTEADHAHIAASRVLVFLVGDSYCDSLEIIYTTRN
jgi:hypothetical protein